MNSKHSLQEITGGPENEIFDATCFEQTEVGQNHQSTLAGNKERQRSEWEATEAHAKGMASHLQL